MRIAIAVGWPAGRDGPETFQTELTETTTFPARDQDETLSMSRDGLETFTF